MRDGDNHALAAVAAFAAFFVFSIVDAFSRHLITAGYGVFVVGAVFQGLALVILLACSGQLGGFKSIAASPNKKFHLGRGALFLVSMTANLYAFAHLPFALVYSLLFTGSLWAILFSRFITNETFHARDTLAVVGGLAGAVIVLRPWDDMTFDWLTVLPVLVRCRIRHTQPVRPAHRGAGNTDRHGDMADACHRADLSRGGATATRWAARHRHV